MSKRRVVLYVVALATTATLVLAFSTEASSRSPRWRSQWCRCSAGSCSGPER